LDCQHINEKDEDQLVANIFYSF